MSAAFVLDASIAMSWCFAGRASAASAKVQERLVNETALVPSLWHLEVANVLAVAERRKKITAADSVELVALLEALGLEVEEDEPTRAFSHLLPLCRAHGITSYDAVYLDLAIRRRLPLATLDEDLRAAAKKVGVELLGK